MSLDRRLNAFRPDLADARLTGTVKAARFVTGQLARVVRPVADLHNAPAPDESLDTQLLLGDEVLVFEEKGGFAWVQALRDSYVGYVEAGALGAAAPAPSHVVTAPRSFVYSREDLKSPRMEALSLGSGVTVTGMGETRGTSYAALSCGGFMIAAHLSPASETAADFVAVAESLLFTPYLWGGTSAFGIDCSGLVQLCLRMAGRDVPRDTDMQAASLGVPLPQEGTPRRRGDLIFWKGHVAIMADEASIIHASGHGMMVVREPLAEAIARIAPLYGMPTGYRRP